MDFGASFTAFGISLLELPGFGAVTALVKDCMASYVNIMGHGGPRH
ncbi:MAG: hypothetical protein L7G96_04175 [Vulcanisaeta sp.]|nr:hypothetical protein [Vulcanisaeta sp.]